ncbi:MAG: hypothetical protein IIY70_02340 [Oscillospiraceae bacterium]|nr:hypothetical protein [Oscillospiraceae bacterium]
MKTQYNSQSASLLRSCSRIMLVYGVFGSLLYLAALAGVLLLGKTIGGIFSTKQDLIGMGLFSLGALVELVAGILGVRGSKHPALMGNAVLVFGGLTLGFAVAETGFLALRSDAQQPLLLALSLVLGLVVPAVYLRAVLKLRKGPDCETVEAGESSEA